MTVERTETANDAKTLCIIQHYSLQMQYNLLMKNNI